MIALIVLLLGLLGLVFGFSLTYRGWVLHVRHIKAEGFILGFLFGLFILSFLGFGLVALFGGLIIAVICAHLAFAVYRLFISSLGFSAGSFTSAIGMLLINADRYIGIFTVSTEQMILELGGAFFIGGIIGAKLAWAFQKFIIIASTAFWGSLIIYISIGIIGSNPGPFLIFIFFSTGILVQYWGAPRDITPTSVTRPHTTSKSARRNRPKSSNPTNLISSSDSKKASSIAVKRLLKESDQDFTSQEKTALRAILNHLQQTERSTPRALQGSFYEKYPLNFQSASTWRNNFLIPALESIPRIEYDEVNRLIEYTPSNPDTTQSENQRSSDQYSLNNMSQSEQSSSKPANRDTDGESPPTSPQDSSTDTVETILTESSVDFTGQERLAVEAVVGYLLTEETATMGELQDKFYEKYPLNYRTADVWWNTFLRPALMNLPFIKYHSDTQSWQCMKTEAETKTDAGKADS